MLRLRISTSVATIAVAVQQISFCRPAIHAALELGTDSFWEVIDTLLTSTALEFEVSLRRLFPEVSDQDVTLWGRGWRRSICAALLDKSITPDELRDELRLLVDGYVIRTGGGGHTVAEIPTSTTTWPSDRLASRKMMATSTSVAR